jgi:hypothetical protein
MTDRTDAGSAAANTQPNTESNQENLREPENIAGQPERADLAGPIAILIDELAGVFAAADAPEGTTFTERWNTLVKGARSPGVGLFSSGLYTLVHNILDIDTNGSESVLWLGGEFPELESVAGWTVVGDPAELIQAALRAMNARRAANVEVSGNGVGPATLVVLLDQHALAAATTDPQVSSRLTSVASRGPELGIHIAYARQGALEDHLRGQDLAALVQLLADLHHSQPRSGFRAAHQTPSYLAVVEVANGIWDREPLNRTRAMLIPAERYFSLVDPETAARLRERIGSQPAYGKAEVAMTHLRQSADHPGTQIWVFDPKQRPAPVQPWRPAGAATPLHSPSPRLDASLPQEIQLVSDQESPGSIWRGVLWHDGTVSVKRGGPALGGEELHTSLTACLAEHPGRRVEQNWTPDGIGAPLPRRFQLRRRVDSTGISGTGIVLRGVEWPDGTVTVKWTTLVASLEHMSSTAVCQQLHGHHGDGVIEHVWTSSLLSKNVRIKASAGASLLGTTGTIVAEHDQEHFDIRLDGARDGTSPMLMHRDEFEVA